jgi:hypothetical protein
MITTSGGSVCIGSSDVSIRQPCSSSGSFNGAIGAGDDQAHTVRHRGAQQWRG